MFSAERTRELALLPRRRVVPLAAAALVLVALSSLRLFSSPAQVEPQPEFPYPDPPRHPPLYTEWHQLELRLPHQNWSKTRPDTNERLMFFGGHVTGAGWGNALQEHLLNAYLNYRAGTTYVFNNYTWNGDLSQPYSDYNGHEIPSRIPYSALIRGPTIGDPFPPGHSAPLPVHKDYFDHICRGEDRVEVVREFITSAKTTIDVWSKIVHESEKPCVIAWTDFNQVFSHHSTFGVRDSLREIWDDFLVSPMITHFGWSTLVELAFDMNRHFFIDTPTDEPYLAPAPYTTNRERYPVIPGLMVVHLRRGDYDGHCAHLADGREDFVTWHTLPGLTPDPFTPPPPGDDAAVREIYRRRCYPTIPEIVERVVAVRNTKAGEGVRRIYIMTNGRAPFLRELEQALHAAAAWDSVASNRDLVLSWEQKFVAQAVDQLVAQRAQVLIGNGFSTLTTLAIVMRKANGFPIESSRLW